jgi:hypothetical protein
MYELQKTVTFRRWTGSCPQLYARRTLRRSSYARSILVAMLLSASVASSSADAESLGSAKVELVAVDKGATLQISGWARVPASAARTHDRRLTVMFSLSGDGHTERFLAGLHGDSFALTHPTKLTGLLRLTARVRDAGRPVGAPAITHVTVTTPHSTPPTASETTPPPSPPAPPSPAPQPPPTERHDVMCSPPVLPTLEPGQGVITGSFYVGGGPPPGVLWCEGTVVTITTPSGEVIAAKTFDSPESVAIAVPAGTYLVQAVATGFFINEQPVTMMDNERVTVTAGSTTELPPVETGFP